MEVQLIIKNLNVYNSYFKKFIQGDVVINDGKFLHIGSNYEERLTSKNIIDGNNKYMIPGLIDIHMHIESSMTIPSEFSKAAIKQGVTTVVADPHEIANVFGIEGIKEFIKSKEKLDIFYGIPSSVPSTCNDLETTGGEITVNEVEELLSYENIICLGEVMNFKDLIEDENSAINNIINISKDKKIPLEGHCPKIDGVDLSFYIYRGVDGDHTQQSVASLEEKIRNGMFIEMQHKSMTTENIKFLVENNLYEHFALATDDVMADKLTKGHLNELVKEAVKLGMTIENAIYVATYTPAKRMRLFDRGTIAPGKIADFILLDEDFSDFPIGEFPYDKNHSAMGEYHFIHYPGYYGKWYDPVCNHTYNGQGASWIISEYNGKHFMEQMRIRNDKPHRTFPMLTSGDRFWRDYTITASVRMFTTKWGNAGIGFCCQNSANLLVLVFEEHELRLEYRHKEEVSIIESAPFDYNCDDTYVLKAEIKGSHVICSVDDKVYFDLDTEYARQGGKVAITATIPTQFGFVNVTTSESTAASIDAARNAYKAECEDAQAHYP